MNSSTAHQQHADAHARLDRDRVDRIGQALEAREGGAGIGEGVDPDPEPGDPVAAEDADHAEEQDDDDLDRLEVLQDPEVEDDDHRDEQLQDHEELALGDQVRLAGLVDQLGDLTHRLVHGQVLELRVDDQAEGQAQEADQEAPLQHGASRHAHEARLGEVGQLERGFSPTVGRRGDRAAGAGV